MTVTMQLLTRSGLGVGGAAGDVHDTIEAGLNGVPSFSIWPPHTVDPDAAGTIAGEITTFPRQGESCVTAQGTLINLVESRTAYAVDYAVNALHIKRSTNGGKSWGPAITLYGVSGYVSGAKWCSLGAIHPHPSGRIHALLTLWNNGTTGVPATAADVDVILVYSDDDGLTWSAGTVVAAAKKQNSDPDTDPFSGGTTEWGFMRYTDMKCLADGTMLAVGYHRYTLDTSGDAWMHSLRFNNAQDSFTLSGTVESAGNKGILEPHVVVCADGTLLALCRNNLGNTFRKVTSSDGGLTWSNTSNVTEMVGVGTSPSIEAWPNGDVWAMVPTDTTIRAVMRVFRTRDNGATWPTSRLLERGTGGYSTMVYTRGRMLALVETIQNQPEHVDNVYGPSEYIRLALLEPEWIDGDPTGSDDYIEYVFNDVTTLGTTGRPIRDRGPRGHHAQGGSGGSISGGNLMCSGAAVALKPFPLRTVPGDAGCPCDGRDESITYEAVLKCSDATPNGKVVFGNRNSGDTIGVSLAFLTGGKLKGTMSDGTTTVDVTSAAAVNDNVMHAVALIRDNVADTLTMKIDGVAQYPTAAATDLVQEIGPLTAPAAGTLSNTGGGVRPTFNTDGTYNGVLDFEADNGTYLELANSSTSFNSFHNSGIGYIFLKVKVEANGTTYRLLDNRSASSTNKGFTLSILSSNVVQISVSGNGSAAIALSSTTTIADTNWHTIEVWLDGVNGNISIDGAAAKTGAITTGNLGAGNALGNLRVGISRAAAGPLDGLLSNVVIGNGAMVAGDRTLWQSFNPTVNQTPIPTGNPTLYTNVALWVPTSYPSIMYTSGTAPAAFNPSGNIIGAREFVVGTRPDGSSGVACEIERFKITHGVPAALRTAGAAKQTLDQFYHYSATAPTSITSIPGLVMWLASTYDQGRLTCTDQWGGFDDSAFPLGRGDGINGIHCAISGKPFLGVGPFHGGIADENTIIGRHYRWGYRSIFKCPVATFGTLLAHLHKTMTGFWSQCFYLASDQDHGLFGNNGAAAAANPGVSFGVGSIANASRAYINITNGVTTLLDSFNVGSLPPGAWHRMIVNFNGDQQPLDVYWGTFPGGLAVPSVINHAQTAAPAAVGTPADSTQDCYLGAWHGTYSSDFRTKNILAGTLPLDASARAALFALDVAY